MNIHTFSPKHFRRFLSKPKSPEVVRFETVLHTYQIIWFKLNSENVISLFIFHMNSKTNSILIKNLDTNMSLIFKFMSVPCWWLFFLAHWRLHTSKQKFMFSKKTDKLFFT